MGRAIHLNVLRVTVVTLFLTMATGVSAGDPCRSDNSVCIDSLNDLTVESLRQRDYSTVISVLSQLGGPDKPTDYIRHYSLEGALPASTFMASYTSDGLRLYLRLDVPASTAPEAGFPMVVFAPGWVSRQDAPGYDFGYNNEGLYGQMIQHYVDNGFAVVTAGYRGRGTVNNIAAQGIEYTDAWGNGSYLSPMFYTIDLLNLLSGLQQLNARDWQQWGYGKTDSRRFNPARTSLVAHSQGGDVALTTLAVVGDNPTFKYALHAASIWSGNIPDRFAQADTFGAMASSLQAFMSGDGSWTGSATGRKGEVNPDFIFPWPSDWIATVDTTSADWNWQAKQWSVPTVREARVKKYREMYDTLNRYVRDLHGVDFKVLTLADGSTAIGHAPAVAATMPNIGGFFKQQYLTTPLALHISDRDYYSIPAWSQDLTARINQAGGSAMTFIYPGTTHSLKISEHTWFSPAGTRDGVAKALARDIQLFGAEDPKYITIND
ncbi:MAG: hypothetical protein V7746_09800 [Halioglobus sp.]